MPRPLPKLGLTVRLTHGLTFLLLLMLTVTGLRIAWYTGAEWLSPGIRAAVDFLLPSTANYGLHALLGVIFASVGVWYAAYMLISRESLRLTNLYHRHEYSWTKKLLYIFTFLVALGSLFSGFSIYAGLFAGPDGYLVNSFLHHWSFRLLWVFTLLHVVEVIVSRKSGVNSAFFGKKFIGFVQPPAMLIALAMGIVGGFGFWSIMNEPAVLKVPEVNRAVIVDGREFEIEWIGADSIILQTFGGANFRSTATPLTIKSFHNGRQIFFLARWTDDTKSLNRHLIKTDSGWVVERSQYAGPFGEEIYHEDQLALYFSRSQDCAGSCHIGAGTEAGYHATGGDTADVWHWQAISTNPVDEAADLHWTGSTPDFPHGMQSDNLAAGGAKLNLDSTLLYPYFVPTTALFRNFVAYSTGAYQPYDAFADTLPIGSRLPAILVAPATGDAGDITARGRWNRGTWTVEFSRRMNTGSGADILFDSTIYFGAGAFDNAQRRHTYHLKPLKLEIE